MNSMRAHTQGRIEEEQLETVSNISQDDDVFEDCYVTTLTDFDITEIGNQYLPDQNSSYSRRHSFANDVSLTIRRHSFDSSDFGNKLIFDVDLQKQSQTICNDLNPRVRSFSCDLYDNSHFDLDPTGRGHNVRSNQLKTQNFMDFADKMVWSLELSEIRPPSEESNIAKDKHHVGIDLKKCEILETISGFNSYHHNQDTSIWDTISNNTSNDTFRDSIMESSSYSSFSDISPTCHVRHSRINTAVYPDILASPSINDTNLSDSVFIDEKPVQQLYLDTKLDMIKIFKDHMALKAEIEDAKTKAEQLIDSKELSEVLSEIPNMSSQWELPSDMKYSDSTYGSSTLSLDQQSSASYYFDGRNSTSYRVNSTELSTQIPTLIVTSATEDSQSSCSLSSSDLSRSSSVSSDVGDYRKESTNVTEKTLQTGGENLYNKLCENVGTMKPTNVSHNTADVSRRNTTTRAIYKDLNQTNMSGNVQCCVMPPKLRQSLKTTSDTYKLSNQPRKSSSEPQLNTFQTAKENSMQFYSEQNIHKMKHRDTKRISKHQKKRLSAIKESDNDTPECYDLEKEFPSPRIPTLEQTIQHGCLPNIMRRKSRSQKPKMPTKSKTATHEIPPPSLPIRVTTGVRANPTRPQSSSSRSSTESVLPRTSTKKHLTSDLPRTSTKVRLIYKTESDIETNADTNAMRRTSGKSDLQAVNHHASSSTVMGKPPLPPRSTSAKSHKGSSSSTSSERLTTTACELRRTYEQRQTTGKTPTKLQLRHTSDGDSYSSSSSDVETDSLSVWTIYESEVNDFDDVFQESSHTAGSQRPLGNKTNENDFNISELSSIAKYPKHDDCSDHALHEALGEPCSMFLQDGPLSPTTSHISSKPDSSKRYYSSDSDLDLTSVSSEMENFAVSPVTVSSCTNTHHALPQHLGYAIHEIAKSYLPAEDIDCSMNATCASIPDMGEVSTPSIYHDTQDYGHNTPDDLSGTWNSESDESSLYESDDDTDESYFPPVPLHTPATTTTSSRNITIKSTPRMKNKARPNPKRLQYEVIPPMIPDGQNSMHLRHHGLPPVGCDSADLNKLKDEYDSGISTQSSIDCHGKMKQPKPLNNNTINNNIHPYGAMTTKNSRNYRVSKHSQQFDNYTENLNGQCAPAPSLASQGSTSTCYSQSSHEYFHSRQAPIGCDSIQSEAAAKERKRELKRRLKNFSKQYKQTDGSNTFQHLGHC